MRFPRRMLLLAMVAVLSVPLALLQQAVPAAAYNYCGYHDRTFAMRAYHWNSTFWVDQLRTEAAKWNNVHSVLSISQTRSQTVPVGNDGESVISWISEASLNNAYNLSWTNAVGWTISWFSNGNCTRIEEADVFFNPAISLFTAQTRVPYNLGYQEIALHELGHVVTHGHENGTLAVMTSGMAVSDVLYTSDKVGWLRSARFVFSVTDRLDMGVFPLTNAGTNKTYATVTPGTVARGSTITINNMTVQNLSSGIPSPGPSFLVQMVNTATGVRTDIGWFAWSWFGPYSEWGGSLTYTVPAGLAAGQYRVQAVASAATAGMDGDSSNNRAVFGTIQVN